MSILTQQEGLITGTAAKLFVVAGPVLVFEHQHRPGHHEQLGRRSGDESLLLCQDRHTVFSEFFQLPPKWGALIVLACRYKFKPARSTHIYLNLS